MLKDERHRFSDRVSRKVRTNLRPVVEIRLELDAIRGRLFSVEWDAATAENGAWFEAAE